VITGYAWDLAGFAASAATDRYLALGLDTETTAASYPRTSSRERTARQAPREIFGDGQHRGA
jgi:hypothetical protein